MQESLTKAARQAQDLNTRSENLGIYQPVKSDDALRANFEKYLTLTKGKSREKTGDRRLKVCPIHL
jgi:hypothetical protein